MLWPDDGCLPLKTLLSRCSAADDHCMRPLLLLDVSSACRWVWDETMPWNFNSEGGVVVIERDAVVERLMRIEEVVLDDEL